MNDSLFRLFRRHEECRILFQLQSLKKEQSRKKAHVEEEGSDDADEFPDSSQYGNSTNQEWVASHATIINQKLCPMCELLDRSNHAKWSTV